MCIPTQKKNAYIKLTLLKNKHLTCSIKIQNYLIKHMRVGWFERIEKNETPREKVKELESLSQTPIF